MFQAAILQQTAEYIYQLEQEKTTLLSQNCHLKRLINQHEGGGSGTTATVPNIGKKRKLEIHHHTIQQQPQNIQGRKLIGIFFNPLTPALVKKYLASLPCFPGNVNRRFTLFN